MRDFYYFTRDRLPRAAIAIAIIWFGVSLLRGKKFESADTDRRSEADDDRKPAALPGEIVGEWKADTENTDVYSAEAKKSDASDVEVQNADVKKNEQGGE